ncbi:MAG: hypothetical protein KKF56_02055 [Nanoarchaeota archaeon]|nr:hypothetical protein [Nanoarchaeota archaeon]
MRTVELEGERKCPACDKPIDGEALELGVTEKVGDIDSTVIDYFCPTTRCKNLAEMFLKSRYGQQILHNGNAVFTTVNVRYKNGDDVDWDARVAESRRVLFDLFPR